MSSSTRYNPTLSHREARSQLFTPSANNPYLSSRTPSPGVSTSGSDPSFRSATPNRKGQYSTSVLESLESQNDDKIEGLSAKVRMLKDITVAIGQEVRESSSLIENMNDKFASTKDYLGGTMKRMTTMARRQGVGWFHYMMFIFFCFFLFWLVRWF
ncbi:protein transport protein bet1 [Saitoella coloradoensis]